MSYVELLRRESLGTRLTFSRFTSDSSLNDVHGTPLVDEALSVGPQSAVKGGENLVGLHKSHSNHIFLIWKQALKILVQIL